MMDEVSTMMAYDAQVMEQMSEQEILACLEAETGPTFTVPTKTSKVKASRLQIMDDEEDEEEEEDPLDKYLKENHRLQEASLRLEQENDSLAHKLISSKVALRKALDKAEDKVDELAKGLLQSRRRLQATEEEKRRMEEEVQMLKEVFRRELEKTEQEVKRSSGIIADYKQICSQLTHRVERQQAAHREELDSLAEAVRACPRCRDAVAAGTERDGMKERGQGEDRQEPRQTEQRKEDQEKEAVRAQIRELERELAQTKLQMVEANCKIQELEHQNKVLATDLHEAKNSWISKAFTSLRTTSLSLPRDGARAVGCSVHSGSVSGWRGKTLLWPHRDDRDEV